MSEFYANPKIPENISSSEGGHLKESGLLILKYVGIVLAVLLMLEIVGRFIAPLTPFSWEQDLARAFTESLQTSQSRPPQDEAIEKELNSLAQRLTQVMDLPPEMVITVHYNDDSLVNAMATVGGNVIIFKGLLEKIESEDALVAVMAHEIAHIKHRDVIKGLIRVVGLVIISSAAWSSSGTSDLTSLAGNLGLLSFSRGQEEAADAAAVEALGRMYGHTQGMERLFEVLKEASAENNIPTILSTHPDTADRIKKARKLAGKLGLKTQGEAVPLKETLHLKTGENE